MNFLLEFLPIVIYILLIIVSSIATPIILKVLFAKEGEAKRDHAAFLYKSERDDI